MTLFTNDKQGEYPKSYYAATADFLEPFPTLYDDIHCDVCIIGGGFTGLSCALNLAKNDIDTVIVDAHRVGWGASGRNGGQLGASMRLDQQELAIKYGDDNARQLWNIAWQAREYVHELAKTYNIDYQFKPGIIYTDHRKRFTKQTKNFVDYMQQHYPESNLSYINQDSIRDYVDSPAYFSGYLNPLAGHLHPLRLALGIAEAAHHHGAKIYEKTTVMKTTYKHHDKVSITTQHATIHAKFLIFAGNGYLEDLGGKAKKYIMPINNYIVASEPLSQQQVDTLIPEKRAICDSKYVVNYFRISDDNRLLFGGHESYRYRFPDNIADKVRRPLKEIFPQLHDIAIDYAWGGTLAITMNRMPYVQLLRSNVFYAGGYSGQGVALANYTGKIIANAIIGQYKNIGKCQEFDVLKNLNIPYFPGGKILRHPLLILGMLYYVLKDKF